MCAGDSAFFEFEPRLHRFGHASVPLPQASTAGAMVAVCLAARPELDLGRDLEQFQVLGQRVAVLIAAHHAAGTLAPFTEVGLYALAQRRGARPSALRMLVDLRADERTGLCPICLAVDTEDARVETTALGRAGGGALREPGLGVGHERVSVGVGLRVALSATNIPVPVPPVAVFTRAGGRLGRAIVEHAARARLARVARLVCAGAHPFAEAFRSVCGEQPRVLFALTAPLRRKILAPVDLGPLSGQ